MTGMLSDIIPKYLAQRREDSVRLRAPRVVSESIHLSKIVDFFVGGQEPQRCMLTRLAESMKTARDNTDDRP